MNYQEFASKLSLTHPVKGKVPYILKDYQLEVLNMIDENDRTVLVKARQIGISTLLNFYAFYRCANIPNTKIAIIDHNNRSAINHIEDIKRFYESMLPYAKTNATTYNRMYFDFKNGSSIAASYSVDAFKGTMFDVFIMDEFAFNMNGKKIYDDVYELRGPHCKTIFSSTPDGTDNEFYNLWRYANRKEKIRLPWTVNPRDNAEEYKKDMIKSIGLDNFRQEFECWFNPERKQEKTEVMNIRLTGMEKQDMEYLAKVKGFRSLSDYIRFLANKDKRDHEEWE